MRRIGARYELQGFELWKLEEEPEEEETPNIRRVGIGLWWLGEEVYPYLRPLPAASPVGDGNGSLYAHMRFFLKDGALLICVTILSFPGASSSAFGRCDWMLAWRLGSFWVKFNICRGFLTFLWWFPEPTNVWIPGSMKDEMADLYSSSPFIPSQRLVR